MNEYRNLAKNTLLFSMGTVGSTVISFFLVMIYTRYLSTSEYGIIDLINTTISLVVPVITLQISDAVFRFTMDTDVDKRKLISTALYFVWTSVLMFSVLTVYIAQKFLPAKLIPLVYLLIAVNITLSVEIPFLKGLKRIKILAMADILSSLFLAMMIIVLLVRFHLGIIGYLVAVLSSWIFKGAILGFKGRIYKYLTLSFDKSLLTKMLSYSLFLMPNMIMWWIVNVSDRYLLAYFFGVGAVGIYAVSYKIPQLLRIPTMIFYQAWQISAVESYNSKNKDQFYTSVFNVYLALLMISLSILLPLLKPITSILFSRSFYESWKYASFLLYGTLFFSLSSFTGVAYIASKESKGALWTSSLAAIVNAGINVILIPFWGIYAAAFSTFIAYFTMWVARMQHTKKFVRIKFPLRKFIISFSITLFQTIILYVPLPFIGLFAFNSLSVGLILVLFRHDIKSLIQMSKELGKDMYKLIKNTIGQSKKKN